MKPTASTPCQRQHGISAPNHDDPVRDSAAAHARRQGAYGMRRLRTGGDAAERAASIVLGLQATLKHEIAPSLCDSSTQSTVSWWGV